MNDFPTVLTVLLNYRTADMTLKALEAAVRETAGIAGSITVVDNDSQDGSYEKIRDAVLAQGWSDRVRVVASGHNGGFGAGNNVAMRLGLPDGSAPDFVYLLNSDAFPEPGSVRILLDAMLAHPHCGFAGGYTFGQDGVYHNTAFRFPGILSEFETAARTGPISALLRRHIVAIPEPAESMEVDWLAGASLLIRRKALDEIGLFDERFFLYFEETDLCLRARRAGWPARYVKESRIMHIGSVSTGMKGWKRMPGYWFDSRLWYYIKNHGPFYAALATLSYVAGSMVMQARQLFGRKRATGPDRFLGDLISHAFRSLWQRKLVGGRPS
ncbi:glycosyltransferase family 2 protein [Hydrogenophaga laconesensis]|uniref:GT2 family glycosyltransferase n=1 Tax=Hydrogenophaga laconesensis TaxID=1805971 RepID=A0ABU1V4H6_9BURK|nr:glycosyltransferase family 2 protein [Hydrogenophaga laconesensis]MDR7092356.1 GT2 family glycosyltransferase [Hydrogenophaga laconesensis]